MATLRSRATDVSHYRDTTMHMRRLQEGLYTHLDEQEKAAFIEVLNTYGVRKDIFELVNSLRKILNTPVKRQLFPLVRGVIRRSDAEAFDLLTRGGKTHGTLPRPFLYRPHAADISVLRKHRSMTLNRYNEISHRRKASSVILDPSDRDESPPVPPNQDVHKIFIETRDDNYDGFGFNIRGGSEYGLGVYVSSVDEGGPAEIQGLQVGDLIVEANDISFQKISHGEAARMIRAANRLELNVCRVGRVPGTHTVHEAYKWVDARGRPVSPPPDLFANAGHNADDTDVRSRSSLNLLKGSDERKVNVVVDRGHSLGLTVRGGRDYGLGIYISGVDPYSVAENAGLKIGDQVLDVNGESMLAVSHAEAVRVLTRCRHMVLTVKDVGRVPYAKTTIDRTHWLSKEASDAYSTTNRHGKFRGRRSHSEPDLLNAGVGFSRGHGSQLMLSVMSKRSQYDVLEDQARVLLNSEEQATLRYYMAEYGRDVVKVPGLVSALVELFNTGAKFTLMSEIRPLIHTKDLDMFDRLVHKEEVHTGFSGMAKGMDVESLSLISGDSADAFMDDHTKRTLFSTKIKPVMPPQMMDALTINIPANNPNPASSNAITTTRNHRAMSDKGAPSHNTSTDQWDSITRITDTHTDKEAPTSSSKPDRSPHNDPHQPFHLHHHLHHHPQQQNQNHQQQPQQQQQHHAAPKLTKPIPFTRTQPVRRQKPRQSKPRSPNLAHVMHVTAATNTGGGGGGASSSASTSLGGVGGAVGGVPGGEAVVGRVGYTKVDVHPRGKHTDDPSDDSGVDVNNHHHHQLDPGRAALGLDGVTISKAVPVEIHTAGGRQSTDTHLTVPSPNQPSTSAAGASSPRVSPRFHEEERRLEGRDKYGDIPLGVVYIYRCKPTLGVAIEGGANTRQPLPRVVTVQPGGSAFESGGLRVGHVILEVNGISLVGRTHTDVARLIAETFKNKEEERMELLVTDSSEAVMDELRGRIAELSVGK